MHIIRRPRVIPVLLIEDKNLIKTIKFKKTRYLGDPINAIKIFNEKEVDELCIIDKSDCNRINELDYDYLSKITSEAFMPLSYGGGIRSVVQAKRLFKIGFEKVILNTEFYHNPNLVTDISNISGSQSVVVSIDYKTKGKKTSVYIESSKKNTKIHPVAYAKMAEKYGAGEILLTSINNDGVMKGYDLKLVAEVSKAVSIPVIANGGCSSLKDMHAALSNGASAIAASSFFVYYGKYKAVLINYPNYYDFIKENIYGN